MVELTNSKCMWLAASRGITKQSRHHRNNAGGLEADRQPSDISTTETECRPIHHEDLS